MPPTFVKPALLLVHPDPTVLHNPGQLVGQAHVLQVREEIPQFHRIGHGRAAGIGGGHQGVDGGQVVEAVAGGLKEMIRGEIGASLCKLLKFKPRI